MIFPAECIHGGADNAAAMASEAEVEATQFVDCEMLPNRERKRLSRRRPVQNLNTKHLVLISLRFPTDLALNLNHFAA